MTRKKGERIQAGKDKTKVLIVDDHPIIRQGLSELINHEPDLIVCGYAEDAPEALGKIKESEPDMVIVDISLKETSGMDLTKDIKAQYPNLPVLALSMHQRISRPSTPTCPFWLFPCTMRLCMPSVCFGLAPGAIL
jgi:DNA-binding NtrC family response regulator